MSTRRCLRHWFAYYRWVGSSSPRCVRCGAPNPRYRPDDDPHAIPEWPDDLPRPRQAPLP